MRTLNFAHQRDTFHCDVREPNILVPEGNDIAVRFKPSNLQVQDISGARNTLLPSQRRKVILRALCAPVRQSQSPPTCSRHTYSNLAVKRIVVRRYAWRQKQDRSKSKQAR